MSIWLKGEKTMEEERLGQYIEERLDRSNCRIEPLSTVGV
ncbi:MAG: hypothetical protein NVS9B9_30380 [Ktedonobacteraceae bacterium]